MPERNGTRRRRRSAEEARERILDHAEARLREVGPDGLRLAELARELGLSHPAILHHFGSRDGLVGAVLERAYARLRADVVESLAGDGGSTDPEQRTLELLERARAVLAERGHARLLAWLVLGGRPLPPAFRDAPLAAVVEGVEATRAVHGGGAASADDEAGRMVHLVGLVLLGDALFGPLLAEMEGRPDGADGRAAFDRWMAGWIVARLLPDAPP